MKTSKLVWGILCAMFIIAFNACFFVLTNDTNLLPNGRIASTWVNYVCVHLAYIMVLLTPFLYPCKVARDVAMPVWTLTLSFWWFELILSTIFIFAEIPLMYNALVQGLCWCAFIVRLCVLILVNENTNQKQIRHEQEIQYVKTAEGQLKSLLANISDKNTYRQVERLYDYVRTSPVKSKENVHNSEREILSKIAELSSITEDAILIQSCSEILKLAQKRNQQIQINNKSL